MHKVLLKLFDAVMPNDCTRCNKVNDRLARAPLEIW